jgi:hypothetical protein
MEALKTAQTKLDKEWARVVAKVRRDLRARGCNLADYKNWIEVLAEYLIEDKEEREVECCSPRTTGHGHELP